MTLYVVRNGYRGASYVGVLVDAVDEAEALKVAADLLRAEDEQKPPSARNGPDYWEDISVHPVELPYVGEFE